MFICFCDKHVYICCKWFACRHIHYCSTQSHCINSRNTFFLVDLWCYILNQAALYSHKLFLLCNIQYMLWCPTGDIAMAQMVFLSQIWTHKHSSVFTSTAGKDKVSCLHSDSEFIYELNWNSTSVMSRLIWWVDFCGNILYVVIFH